MALNDTLDQVGVPIQKQHFILKEQNTHPFQVHMEHSPEQITHYITKQVSKIQKDQSPTRHLF